MKILVIAANREKFPDPVFPLGASYIEYAIRRAGYETAVFDACFSEEPLEALSKSLKTNNPDVVVLSIRNVDDNAFPIAVSYLPYYQSIIKTVRDNSKAIIIVGGSAFSIFPELFLKELQVDYGVRGEGEYSLIKLLDELSKNIKIKNRLIVSTTIENIDIDSFPDRKGFDVDKYFKYSGCLNIQTKRGCSLSCSYCTYPVLEGHKFRFRSPKRVIDEIEYWYNEKGIDYIFFVDNVFNLPESFAMEVCNEIIKRNLKINWTGFFVPRLKNEDFVDACIESGCTSMDFGTDAFSNPTLQGFNKSFTKEDIFRSCEICKKKEIKFNHSIIFGGPNETRETLDETIKNIDATTPSSVIGFIGVRLYPGTLLAQSLSDIDIGIKPVFYIAEGVKSFLVEYLQDLIEKKNNWIIPGLEQFTNKKIIKRIRDKGIKGPLWEILTNFR